MAPDRILSDGVEIRASTGELADETQVVWCVRSERVSLAPDGRYPATLIDDVDLGTVRELTLALDGGLTLTLRYGDSERLEIGQSLRLDLPPEDIAVWPLAEEGSEESADESQLIH